MSTPKLLLNLGVLAKYSVEEANFILSKNDEPNSQVASLTKPLVQVENIVRLSYCERTVNNTNYNDFRYRIELSDGEDVISCTIDKEFFSLIEMNIDDVTERIFNTSYSYKSGDDLKLKRGSILIINRVKLLPIECLFSKDEYENYKEMKNVICISNFNIIGYNVTSSVNNKELALFTKSNENQLIEKNNLQISKPAEKLEITHTISKLQPCFSKFYWSIHCKLISRTPIKEFDRNGINGRYTRLLLQDQSGQIEAVVFDDLCDSESIKNLKLQSFYIFRNGDIKPTQIKAWKEYCTSRYEIKINKTTEIFESFTKVGLDNNEFEYDNDTYQELDGNFVRFSEIILQDKNLEFDIIGLIYQIEEISALKTKYQKEISVRYVELIDRSSQKVNVSFWGKQAEAFNHAIGTCLIITNVKVTNYKGITCLVQRSSEIEVINSETNIGEAKKMIEWWQIKKSTTNVKAIEYNPNTKNEINYVTNNANLRKIIYNKENNYTKNQQMSNYKHEDDHSNTKKMKFF